MDRSVLIQGAYEYEPSKSPPVGRTLAASGINKYRDNVLEKY